MKTITFTRAILVILPLFLLSFDPNQNFGVPEEIYSSLKAGNSKVLAKYFNENIELVVFEKEGVYSKIQAELVVREFFSKNTPLSFTKLFEGKSEKGNSKYVICKLTTAKSKFRIYFVMKNNNGEFTIHQLRIENDNN
jgi:hypothetical protein